MNEEVGKRLSRDDRREQIIQAALVVFIEKGFASTTTSEIAKAAGISEVTLFRNFNSKKEIFYAGIDPILLKAMDKDITPVNDNFDSKQIEEIIFNRIKFLEDHRGIVKLILNENMLNQKDENYIHKMVLSLKEMLEKNKVVCDEFTIRLLMGSFLSFLYQPEAKEELVVEYAKRLSELIMRKSS